MSGYAKLLEKIIFKRARQRLALCRQIIDSSETCGVRAILRSILRIEGVPRAAAALAGQAVEPTVAAPVATTPSWPAQGLGRPKEASVVTVRTSLVAKIATVGPVLPVLPEEELPPSRTAVIPYLAAEVATIAAEPMREAKATVHGAVAPEGLLEVRRKDSKVRRIRENWRHGT